MAEITRVPLKPINKGSLVMLFVGIVIGLLIAAAFAWISAPKGVSIEVVEAGSGENPTENDIVFLHYTGKLEDGTVFDQSQEQPLPLDGFFPEGTPLQLTQVVPGFREGVMQMQRGGSYVLTIPAEKGYGSTPPPGSPIPADADLIFDIEVVDFMPLEEANQRLQQMQQIMMQQMQEQGGGAPGSASGSASGPAPVPAP